MSRTIAPNELRRSILQQWALTLNDGKQIDLSIGGNVAGAPAIVSDGSFVLAGGNNVTLSQVGHTVTISAANVPGQSVQTQNLFDLTIGGNTAGVGALISSGTATFYGGNNITLSQAGNNLTISGPNTSAQSVQTQNCVDLSLGGNTSGALALISSGTAVIFGGNNVTLSQNGQSVTISAANTVAQSVQTQNCVDLTIGGNTSGAAALISSGTAFLAGGNNITLSQNANSITFSAASQSVQTQSLGSDTLGISNLGNTSGTSGVVSGSNAQLIIAGGNNVTLSQSINGVSATVTISAFNQSVQTQMTGLTAGMSTQGNTSGTTGLVSNQLIIVGGNNVTLSQSVNGQSATLTISAFNQSVQTQNAVDLSLSGNTSGTLTLISSGTAILAGGNNITLSQNGQSITISAFNQSVQTQSLGSDTLGMSNLGNTSGTTGVVSGSNVQLLLAGGNNITLSQSINGVSATITISAGGGAQTVQTQNCVDWSLSGNTSGTLALISSGTGILAGGNNVTLSQNGQSVTISAANQTVQTQHVHDLSLAGNTSGTLTLISSGTAIFAGGNNITLSQNGQSITISAFNQSVQTQNCVDISIAGNTAGTATIISSGTAILAGGSNVTLSQSGQTISINAAPVLSVWNNLIVGMDSGATSNNTVVLFPLAYDHPFPGNMTVQTARLHMTCNMSVTSASSQAHTYTVYFGIYTLNGNTLSLFNSASTTFGSGATNRSFSTMYHGMRYLTFNSTQFSQSTLSLLHGGNYIGAVMMQSSGTNHGFSFLAGVPMNFASFNLSGTLGASVANASTGGYYWLVPGFCSVTGGGLPASIHSSAVSHTLGGGGYMNDIPRVQFDNLLSSF